jgi:hypothetical protein
MCLKLESLKMTSRDHQEDGRLLDKLKKKDAFKESEV